MRLVHKLRRSGVTYAGYNQDFRVRDAKLLLKQRAANSISSCFLNPNARCPECGDPVFFYANAAGSRVFFDQLGPPWPKHWCTDRSRRARDEALIYGDQISARQKGEAKELLAAANTTGMARFQVFGNRRQDEWTLVAIHTVDRSETENRVEGEFLDSETHEAFCFIYYSESPLFEAGDFLSVNGGQISFVHRGTLQPVVFTAGSWVRPEPPAPKQSAPKPQVPAKPANHPKPAQLIRATKSREARDEKPGYDMTKAEMVH